MHKQSLQEIGECVHVSHLNLTMCWVGVQLCSATKFSSLSLHMVPQHNYGCARWWSVGMHPVLLLALHELSSRSDFWDILALLLLRKIDFPCAYKAY